MSYLDFLNLEYIFLVLYRLFVNADVDKLPVEELKNAWSLFTIFSTALSLLLATGVVYCLIRLWQLRRFEVEKFGSMAPAPFLGAPEVKNERWERITDLVNSENPSDWRQAILEADVLLDELVTRLGYRGETLGEKMKQIEPSDFTTLDLAWEAHKVRNDIAHRGSDFILSKREAKRVVGLFEKVFREFEYL